jgi:CheY-like chemotaxis protein
MQRKHLLIVDDSARFRGAVKRSLTGAGYTLYEAGSVAEGINQLNLHPQIRVILLDLSLPDGSGADFLLQIEKRATNYRVIILTAHEEELVAEQASQLSVFTYLPKAGKSSRESLRFNVSQAFADIARAPHPVRVFISYTNPDFDKVTWIYRRLQDNGFVPWIDKTDLQPGYAWDKGIEIAINESDCVLSLISL